LAFLASWRFRTIFAGSCTRINFVKIAAYALIAILVLLQYPLWFGDGGVIAAWQLKREIAAQQKENEQLRERNRALEAQVNDLKQGLEVIEGRARSELGMVKKGETFYQVIEKQPVKREEGGERRDELK